jgi:hypothetical protein
MSISRLYENLILKQFRQVIWNESINEALLTDLLARLEDKDWVGGHEGAVVSGLKKGVGLGVLQSSTPGCSRRYKTFWGCYFCIVKLFMAVIVAVS